LKEATSFADYLRGRIWKIIISRYRRTLCFAGGWTRKFCSRFDGETFCLITMQYLRVYAMREGWREKGQLIARKEDGTKTAGKASRMAKKG